MSFTNKIHTPQKEQSAIHPTMIITRNGRPSSNGSGAVGYRPGQRRQQQQQRKPQIAKSCPPKRLTFGQKKTQEILNETLERRTPIVTRTGDDQRTKGLSRQRKEPISVIGITGGFGYGKDFVFRDFVRDHKDTLLVVEPISQNDFLSLISTEFTLSYFDLLMSRKYNSKLLDNYTSMCFYLGNIDESIHASIKTIKEFIKRFIESKIVQERRNSFVVFCTDDISQSKWKTFKTTKGVAISYIKAPSSKEYGEIICSDEFLRECQKALSERDDVHDHRKNSRQRRRRSLKPLPMTRIEIQEQTPRFFFQSQGDLEYTKNLIINPKNNLGGILEVNSESPFDRISKLVGHYHFNSNVSHVLEFLPPCEDVVGSANSSMVDLEKLYQYCRSIPMDILRENILKRCCDERHTSHVFDRPPPSSSKKSKKKSNNSLSSSCGFVNPTTIASMKEFSALLDHYSFVDTLVNGAISIGKPEIRMTDEETITLTHSIPVMELRSLCKGQPPQFQPVSFPPRLNKKIEQHDITFGCEYFKDHPVVSSSLVYNLMSFSPTNPDSNLLSQLIQMKFERIVDTFPNATQVNLLKKSTRHQVIQGLNQLKSIVFKEGSSILDTLSSTDEDFTRSKNNKKNSSNNTIIIAIEDEGFIEWCQYILSLDHNKEDTSIRQRRKELIKTLMAWSKLLTNHSSSQVNEDDQQVSLMISSFKHTTNPASSSTTTKTTTNKRQRPTTTTKTSCDPPAKQRKLSTTHNNPKHIKTTDRDTGVSSAIKDENPITRKNKEEAKPTTTTTTKVEKKTTLESYFSRIPSVKHQ